MDDDKSRRFIDLPDLVLLRIASFLSNKDLAAFSSACCKLNVLLPKIYFIKIGDKTHIDERSRDTHFGSDQFYFDTLPLPGHITHAEMSVEWKDQGWGNRKAYIFIHLIRGGETIVKTDHSCGFFNAPAPHDYEVHTCILLDNIDSNKRNNLQCNGLLKESQKEDILRFFLNCGGGGGHSMKVKNFQMSVRFS